MNVDDMTTEQLVEFLKSACPSIPEWMLDTDRMKARGKITEAELMEFAEFHCSQLRTNIAVRYLRDSKERFGTDPQGEAVFIHQNVVMQIDQAVIETLLQHQIDPAILEEKPAERYIAVMRFYMGDDISREQNGSTWMRDFIDSVLIEGSQAILLGEALPTKNLH